MIMVTCLSPQYKRQSLLYCKQRKYMTEVRLFSNGDAIANIEQSVSDAAVEMYEAVYTCLDSIRLLRSGNDDTIALLCATSNRVRRSRKKARRPILSQLTTKSYEFGSIAEASINTHSLTDSLRPNEELNLYPDNSPYLPPKPLSQSPKISPSSIPNPNPSVTTTKTIESGYPKYGGYLYSIPGYSAFQPINYQNLALTTSSPTFLPNEHSSLWSSIRKDSICTDVKILDDKNGIEPTISKSQTDFDDNFTPEIVSPTDTKNPLNQESRMQITSLAQGSGATITIPREPERISLKTSIPISRLDLKCVNSDNNFQYAKKIHAPYANISSAKAENTRVEIQSNIVIKSANCKDVETKANVAENRSVNASNISTLIDAAEALKKESLHWENPPDGIVPKQESKDNCSTLNTQPNPQTVSSLVKSTGPIKQIAVDGSSIQDASTKTSLANVSDNYNDQKNQILFFPNKNSSNPKMLLTISQTQHNPQVLLQRTNFEPKNAQAPSRLSTPAKPNEELSGNTENSSEVVSLKRLHQDDGDENDFENLITENQIYGNKIVVKEKSQGTLQERDLKNKNVTNKTPDKNVQTTTDTKSLVIQPNILYVSNVQFPANLMMFKNSKINQIEQLKMNKNAGNEIKVNEFPTVSTSEPANSYPGKYSSPHTIAISKEIHVLKPNSNLIQTFSNKQTNKTDIVLQSKQKMIMNPQIVYQVPMLVDAESISANVQKLTTPFVSRDYPKFINTQNTKKDLTKGTYDPTSQQNEKLFIACPYQVDSKLQPKIVITNIRPKLPKSDEISALDLYEKRRRMRRIKYLSNRENKDLRTEMKKNIEKVEGKNIITPDKMKAEVYKEFKNTKLIFESDSSCSEDEYGEKDLIEYEDIIKEYEVPKVEEETNKVKFLSGLRLATHEMLKDLELQRQERSLSVDAVASAYIAVGRLDRIYGSEDSSMSEDKPIFKSSLQNSLQGDSSSAESHAESRQASQSKLAFFGQLELTAVSQQYKEDYEYAWREILKERCRREGLANAITTPHVEKETDKLALDTKGQLQILTEIKRSVTENNKLIKQRFDRCCEETDAETISALAEKNFSELDKLSKMADRSVKMLSLDHRKRDLNPGFDSENVPSLVLLNRLEQPFHNAPKLNIPNVSKIISLKSYQELSVENTCQATSMDEPQNCAGGAKQETQCEVTDIEKNNVDWSAQEEKAPPWPGIEALIRSYRNFDATRHQELSELTRRNTELRAAAARWTAEAARRGEVVRALLAERASLAAEEAAVRASLQKLLAAVHTLTQ